MGLPAHVKAQGQGGTERERETTRRARSGPAHQVERIDPPRQVRTGAPGRRKADAAGPAGRGRTVSRSRADRRQIVTGRAIAASLAEARAGADRRGPPIQPQSSRPAGRMRRRPVPATTGGQAMPGQQRKGRPAARGQDRRTRSRGSTRRARSGPAHQVAERPTPQARQAEAAPSAESRADRVADRHRQSDRRQLGRGPRRGGSQRPADPAAEQPTDRPDAPPSGPGHDRRSGHARPAAQGSTRRARSGPAHQVERPADRKRIARGPPIQPQNSRPAGRMRRRPVPAATGGQATPGQQRRERPAAREPARRSQRGRRRRHGRPKPHRQQGRAAACASDPAERPPPAWPRPAPGRIARGPPIQPQSSRPAGQSD